MNIRDRRRIEISGKSRATVARIVTHAERRIPSMLSRATNRDKPVQRQLSGRPRDVSKESA
jgi:hypothetical protein